jgi:hypothetical protein
MNQIIKHWLSSILTVFVLGDLRDVSGSAVMD